MGARAADRAGRGVAGADQPGGRSPGAPLRPRGSCGGSDGEFRPRVASPCSPRPYPTRLVAMHGVEPALFRQLLGRFATGVTVLDGVLASIECERQDEAAGGDHTVFFGLVIGGSVTDRSPLLYYRGGYASLRGG